MTDDEHAIRELVATWMEASDAGDVNTMPTEGDARRGYALSILRKQSDGKCVLWRDANLVA
jgi:hypothetical protein